MSRAGATQPSCLGQHASQPGDKVAGNGIQEEEPDKFATPEGVEIRGNTIWFSDSGNDRVLKYELRRQ
ncbi:MAG: hypothetical protein JSU95_10020 [Betaproteobacteria bacterium]|nr:MAG: hypothetical protein JSU95_10020 [Betaproteobacteria bacterium]